MISDTFSTVYCMSLSGQILVFVEKTCLSEISSNTLMNVSATSYQPSPDVVSYFASNTDNLYDDLYYVYDTPHVIHAVIAYSIYFNV
jgi:hypothetical protein